MYIKTHTSKNRQSFYEYIFHLIECILKHLKHIGIVQLKIKNIFILSLIATILIT